MPEVQPGIPGLRLNRSVYRPGAGGDFSIEPYDDHWPLICFVNPKSGGQSGEALQAKLKNVLTPEQVFDFTAPGGPEVVLRKFTANGKYLPFRILACGGDGSVGWILSELDKINFPNEPPVSILPLGTGNDMARTLGWGGGYDTKDNLTAVLERIARGKIVNMDRWEMVIESNKHADKVVVVNNYFSVGIDAEIALEFHELRNANPKKFKSRTHNKFVYGKLGAKKVLKHRKLAPHVVMEDAYRGKVDIPSNAEGIIMTTLPSYQAGHNFWGTKKLEQSGHRPCMPGDEIFEVMSVSGAANMARLQGKIGHATRLNQTNSIRIVSTKPLVVQADGEPWREEGPFSLSCKFHKKSPMIASENCPLPQARRAHPLAHSNGPQSSEGWQRDIVMGEMPATIPNPVPVNSPRSSNPYAPVMSASTGHSSSPWAPAWWDQPADMWTGPLSSRNYSKAGFSSQDYWYSGGYGSSFPQPPMLPSEYQARGLIY